MGPAKRQSGTSLGSRLFGEFFRFSFFRAVALLERFSPGKKKLGAAVDPGDEPVRFSSKPGLSFPPSDVVSLKKPEGKKQPEMEIAFLGLTGPTGVLPHWYTELMLERTRERDFALVDFLDIFHHRLVTLFYLAWKRTRLTANYEDGGMDRLSSCYLHLIGMGEDLRGRIGLPEESLIHCSGLMGRSVPTAAAVEAAVKYISGAEAEVEQFIERMIPLDPADTTSLGLANATLGRDTVCGSFVRDCQSKFRIRIGPVSFGQYSRLLPGGDLLAPIFALVRYMVGIEYEFEIVVALKADEAPACRLGESGAHAPRLGVSTWSRSPGLPLGEDPFVVFQEGDVAQAAHP